MRRRAWWCCPLIGPALVLSTGGAPAASVAGTLARPTAMTQPTSRVTTTPQPPATSTPTPLQPCVKNLCLVVTPTPTSKAGTGSAPANGNPPCDAWNPGTWMPCLTAGGIQVVTAWVNDLIATANVADIWTQTAPALTYANPVIVRYWDGIR